MNLAQRILQRSGRLTFDPEVDTEGAFDLRLKWIAQLGLHASAVIDFGCWTGAALSSLPARRRVGLDVPGPWVDVARRRLPQGEIRPVASFESLPTDLEDAFDLALFLDTLEHIPRGSERAVLESIYASLRSEGTLILTTPAAGLAAALDPAWLLVGHRHYRERTLRDLLHGAGFVDVAIYYSGNWRTAVDVLELYAYKHILRRARPRASHPAAQLDTGLYKRRRVDSAAVWAICRRP